MESATIEQNISIKGHYRLIEADPSKAPVEYGELLAWLKENPLSEMKTEAEKAYHRDHYNRLVSRYNSKAQVAVYEFDNLVPTVGRNVLARLLAGDVTYSGEINYFALGSGVTAPANGDTQLGTETYRQATTSQTTVNNIAYLSCFIVAGSATGTHAEGGLFIDGTGSANSGQLFSHVLFSPNIVKSALNSLTLDTSITLT